MIGHGIKKNGDGSKPIAIVFLVGEHPAIPAILGFIRCPGFDP